MHRLSFIAVASLAWLAVSGPAARAQLNTQHIKGIVGLKSGTQAPPHWYFIGPLIYTYGTDSVRDRDGNRVGPTADLRMLVVGTGFNRVTTKKILGGTYGFQVLFAGVNDRIQGTDIDLNPGAGISDTIVSPISLGWHLPRLDVTTGYSVFVPTGRYSAGATDNTGLGMWGHEVSLGATAYLDESRRFHGATLASIDVQSKKEDSDTKVGTALNLEGGLGADMLQGGLTAGLSYYAQIKLAEDRIDGVPGFLVRGRNRVFALGPEVSLALARKGVLYGFLKVTYQWEVYAQTTTQGSAFNVVATFPIAPIRLPTR